ncbi:12S rRNA N(4)-cytidine methyltransferase METTL15 isoform X2 [Engystomops pustulosus]|uniref:12S rRNA N(4)-cytidine methyltransferase METTL15 isoform X2 n=1 Tax=Engystomops pustulosus TaxID=76066 RepID=UPI003AFB56E8
MFCFPRRICVVQCFVAWGNYYESAPAAVPCVSDFRSVLHRLLLYEMHPSVRRAVCGVLSRLHSAPVPPSRRFCQTDASTRQVLHQPVMVNEVISCLSPQEGQTILDMTFGAGGHTTSILKQAPNIKVLALDRDPAAYSIAQRLSCCAGYSIQPLLGRFSECEDLLLSVGIQPGEIDGVLIDAGCSSMQFDQPERGFSLSKDGPLDMRMDHHRSTGTCVYPENIRGGETRQENSFSHRTGVCLYERKDLLQRPAHVATKTFQALRIFVNDELNQLHAGLQTAQKFLRPGGRLVAISFHSLEDRIVKRFLFGIPMDEKPNLSARHRIRQGQRDFMDVDDDEQFTNPPPNLAWKILQRKVLKPEQQDVLENPRGRSAKLRAAIKLMV